MNMAIDDIRAFLPDIPAEEYEVRRKIRTCRNAATFKLTRSDSEHARALCDMVAEFATFWVYRPATIESLKKAVAYMAGLLKSADEAEDMRSLV